VDVRWGYAIWVLALVPPYAFAFGTELLTSPSVRDIPPMPRSVANDAALLNYVSVSFALLLICGSLLIYSLRRQYREVSAVRQRSLKLHGILSCALLCALVVSCVSLFDWDVEILSHQMVYARAASIGSVSALLTPTCLQGSAYAFHPFSALPMTNILVAFSAVIFISFELSVAVTSLSRRTFTAIENWRSQVETAAQEMKWAFVRLVVILVMSSASTALYFRLGVEAGGVGKTNAYASIASAMSVYWGIVFSLMLVALFVVPFLRYQTKIAELERSFAGYDEKKRAELQLDTQPYTLLRVNVGYVVSAFMPVMASFIGPIMR
jgi:hypothetical protein